MDGDPYAAMVAMMHEQGADRESASVPRMRLGRVTGAAPLRVRVAGTEQPAGALRLDPRLEVPLAAGDEVLLLTWDDQTFYIVMKAVRA